MCNQPARACAARRDVEIVERKGIGHPDTICDALAEELSRGLCRFYLEHFGVVLHHNVDKVLLWGGASKPAFGAGEVIEPMEIYLAGRATTHFKGVRVPLEDIAHDACERWFAEHLHALDPRQHIKLHVLIRPGSSELVELFLRRQRNDIWLANDTSCGAGYAPLSRLEGSVLEAERALVSPATTSTHPAFGEDVKVMGIRRDDRLHFTVSCAMIGKHLVNLDAYLDAKQAAANVVKSALSQSAYGIEVEVNTADDPVNESIFLTVLGTSAEAGDDGEAGRGNRANGLITPFRAMTMESVAGKNPLTHVGKLYNVAARRIASQLVAHIETAESVQCALVSRIGQSVADPQIVDIQTTTSDDQPVAADDSITEIVHDNLARLPQLYEEILRGEAPLY